MLFQKNVVKKYLGMLPEEQTSQAWDQYKSYFLNPSIQQNILQSKEEQFQVISADSWPDIFRFPGFRYKDIHY